MLALALPVILNRSTVSTELRDTKLSNVLLGLCLARFGFLAALQVRESVTGPVG